MSDAKVCGYRSGENGEVESCIFDGDTLPEGWFDDPAKVKPAAKKKAKKKAAKKKAG